LAAVLALALFAAGQGFAEVGFDDEDAPVRMPKRFSRTIKSSPPDEDDSDGRDEDSRLAAPVPPKALRRPPGESKAVKKVGRATPISALPPRDGNVKTGTEDPFLDDSDESAPTTSLKSADRGNRSRDAEMPERHTTIDRSAIDGVTLTNTSAVS
jgi:hypothetical protein